MGIVGKSNNISPWVAGHAGHIPKGAEVLDVACGSGRHSRFFIERGCSVTGIDRDLSRLGDLRHNPRFTAIECDLETEDTVWPVAAGRFLGVIVTNYLWRPLWPHLIAALAPGGILIYETFMQGHERFGRPKNPDFLLAPGELQRAFGDALDILDFWQGQDPEPAMRQRICARRPQVR